MTVLEGLLWLTLNVYHEARSEPQIGQIAVAQVTLNRALQEHRPIKEIVQEPFQFSWTFQKESYFPDDPKAFLECMKSVYIALQSEDVTKGATHYHVENIKPYWSDDFTYLDQFGAHKFYKEEP
jgi:N-acetylmuramoyl-L-alanine amidase